MECTTSILLTDFIRELSFDVLYLHDENARICRSDVARPGLPLTGFFDGFEAERIQVIGLIESKYLDSLSPEDRRKHIFDYMEKKPVCLIFARNMEPDPAFIEAAKIYGVPVLRSSRGTSSLYAAMAGLLSVELAPSMTQHGVLIEIYGEGVLIIGDSGIGKSETAIELVKRGHRLIADDAVEIKRVSDKTLVGSAPKLIKHYIELRGIGIVDVRRIFGMGAVKESEKIDLVIKLENWQPGKLYERLGSEDEYTNIMGNNIPSLTIPVKPGRNLAVILEIAAMNNRQKKMGYNTALELEKKILSQAMEPKE